ncbi:MAG: efflux RND transporter periplasmic adaptor subunit [Myxococcales bacterium]|nr:efflux RND transporter periplasmic adaptor subunit [Myxococcales bacterium]
MATATPLEPSKVVPIRQVSLPELIERERHKRSRRRLITAAVVVVAALLTAGIVWFTRPKPTPMAERFRTAAVTRGPVVREVLATGRVEAVSTVSVGAEISGRVSTVEVDFNDRVTEGQVMARFDQGALQAQAAQSAAMAAASKAQLAQANADLAQAQRNKVRSDGLFAQGAQTQTEHEAAVTAVSLATARVGAAEATLAAQQAQASLARTNLTHAVIRAPIDGVVITRNIDPGQTVASMLQTPVLFTVAADLRKMEVVAAIDEADIGEVHEGHPAAFTVNAYQGRTFEGVVTSVRNSARVVQDVVTYGAVIAVENMDLALKPGMTASARVRTGKVDDAERVPNAALHFTPPESAPVTGPGVWVLAGDALKRLPVHPGLTDGELTAIGDTDVPRDAQVLVDLTPEGKKAYGLAKPK